MKKAILAVIIILLVIFIFLLVINFFVRFSTKNQIIKEENYSQIKDMDCILILGAGVWGENPSPMLKDRLDTGIDLYKRGLAKKIIMSGDHGSNEYDEVNIMKKYAIDKGVASEDIFMDHAGFSTYESIYRAKEIFGVEKLIIVTQKYHIYRALYIADSFGLKAYGVDATKRKYGKEFYREFREIFARDKDAFQCIFKPKPKYLGEAIPVNGNGDITNDK